MHHKLIMRFIHFMLNVRMPQYGRKLVLQCKLPLSQSVLFGWLMNTLWCSFFKSACSEQKVYT
jgi:hypothetical protein